MSADELSLEDVLDDVREKLDIDPEDAEKPSWKRLEAKAQGGST